MMFFPPSLLVGDEWYQGNAANTLDGRGQHPLVNGTIARDPARHDLSAFRYKTTQHLNVLVIDKVDLVAAKSAAFAAEGTAVDHLPGTIVGNKIRSRVLTIYIYSFSHNIY